MTRVGPLQNKLLVKVFQELGSSTDLYTINTLTTDKWGDESNTYNAPVTITVAPYNLTYNQILRDNWGDYSSGETDFIIKHDQSFGQDDIFLYDGIYWAIELIEKYPLNSDSAAFRVRCRRADKQTAPPTA